MKARLFDFDKDYQRMAMWSEERSFPMIPKELLPPVGVMIEKDDNPVCAGFLYYTNGGVAILDHLISDRKVDRPIRDQCIDYMITYLTQIARENGFKMLSAATNLGGLSKRYEEHGFRSYDKNVTHFSKEL